MTRALFLSSLIVSALTLTQVAPLGAQESRCADCHFANPQSDPNPQHLSDWESSAHGRNNVGCEKCHGGDPSSFESFLAHRGVLTSHNPASRTHRTNLPETCGGCHPGPFVAFQKSRHYQLLREGKDDGPTCSTCHGAVAARLLSARGLEKRCERCHGPEGRYPQPEVAVQGKVLLAEVSNVRALLRQASEQIRRIEDEARRKTFQESYDQAEVPLVEAVDSAHAFVFDQMRERLRTARERAETLLNALANPALGP